MQFADPAGKQRQYAGFATAEESNKRYRYLLEQGQTGLSIAFDLPTQIGYDSDDPMAHGEVGKVGVAIDSLADMEVLFQGIPLDKVSSSMTINAPAAVLLAFYIAAAEKQGVPASALKGTIQNDILKEYAARGTYIFPPAPSMRLITNTFEFCSQNVPKWNTISISGYHIREAGSTAAQEIAFTLADGIAYVEAALEAGMDIDEFAGRLSFFFNAHNNLLEEVAKYRAARRLWAKIMKERFHAKKDRSMMLRFHTQTGGSTLTAQQPDNNIVRVAIQTLAGPVGAHQLQCTGLDAFRTLRGIPHNQYRLSKRRSLLLNSAAIRQNQKASGQEIMEIQYIHRLNNVNPLIISQNLTGRLTDYRIHMNRINGLHIRMLVAYPADGTEHMLHRLA